MAALAARLESMAGVRDRGDFEPLADPTKRVDNILTKGAAAFTKAEEAAKASEFEEDQAAAIRLRKKIDADSPELDRLIGEQSYAAVIDLLAAYVEPVEQFFVDALVVDEDDPAATLARRDLLRSLHDVLTRCFDLRELAGQAVRKGS